MTSATSESKRLAADIVARNCLVDTQLHSSKSVSFDVLGDGNCLFRAVSFCVFASQDRHGLLRHQAAEWVEKHGNPVLVDGLSLSPDDGLSMQDHLRSLRSEGTSVGEDAIIALSHVLNRNIIVYIAGCEPLVYKPSVLNGLEVCSQEPSISLAFYEPGHFKAVVPLPLEAAAITNEPLINMSPPSVSLNSIAQLISPAPKALATISKNV